MVNGEIFYARYPITVDVNAPEDFGEGIESTIFPSADFEIISSETVPISGGHGKTNAVMLIVARALT